MTAGFQRLGETDRGGVTISVDGAPLEALQGDTLLVALRLAGLTLGPHDTSGAARGGFCLMGACQDCWLWAAEGGRIRACTTYVEEGMAVLTRLPEGRWPTTAL
ncbi:MAG: (2Fe-2S)-binding protein [Alphaproteobacteria bacterium]|nr:(2Fe-2S)-binding protein [Alphaproteobacteria bacterium]